MNNNKILIIILILLLIILLLEFVKKSKTYKNKTFKTKTKTLKRTRNQKAGFQNKKKKLLNIYNEPLEKCSSPEMSNGSWDSDGYCSEAGGGVHQICIKEIAKNTKNFSLNTKQSNWSDKRGKNNHCVCLGAWSLYNANQSKKGNKKSLKCDAIPKMAFSDKYVSKFSEGWNKWNGYELDNQIVDGIDGLMRNCYNPKSKSKKSKNLKSNYCKFSKNHSDLKKSEYYKSLCK